MLQVHKTKNQNVGSTISLKQTHGAQQIIFQNTHSWTRCSTPLPQVLNYYKEYI